jgi:hypothetical protein
MKNSKLIYVFVVIALAGLLLLQKCHHETKLNKKVKETALYNDTAHFYKDRYNNIVYYNQILNVNKQVLIKELLELKSEKNNLQEELKKFKHINTGTVIKTKIEIIKDTIWFTGIKQTDFKPIKINKIPYL